MSRHKVIAVVSARRDDVIDDVIFIETIEDEIRRQEMREQPTYQRGWLGDWLDTQEAWLPA